VFLDSQISPNPSLSRGERVQGKFPLDKGGVGEAEGDLCTEKDFF